MGNSRVWNSPASLSASGFEHFLVKAVLSLAAGGPDSLVVSDVPEPAPRPTDVLVAVKACGINFPDGLLIRDKYQTGSAPASALG